MRIVKIFVSSPRDVEVERRRVERVARRLNSAFAGIVQFQTVRYETSFYTADRGFQEQIVAPAACDIVLAIFKSKLGTPLPVDKFALPTGEAYPSGSAYEVLSAIEAAKVTTLPDVFVFRSTQAPAILLDDPKREAIEAEWQRLKGFFARFFVNETEGFKAAFHKFANADAFEKDVEALLRDWLSRKVTAGRAVVWPIAVLGSPFRGLASFGAKHASVFFGRERETVHAVERLQEAAEKGTAFLLINGLSGAGKSSFAKAGIAPRLTTPGVIADIDIWRVATLRPGIAPLTSLAQRLFDGPKNLPPDEEGREPALPELKDGDHDTPASLATLFAGAPEAGIRPILKALGRIEAEFKDKEAFERQPRAALLIIIDQLDELFAPSVKAEERSAFAALLTTLAQSGRVYVVATLRADLTAAFLREPALRQLREAGAELVLAPPGPAEMAAIVSEPAKAAGLDFETGVDGESLDIRLLKDADRPDMLPLLQLALDKLFEARITRGDKIILPFSAYGGADGKAGLAGLIAAEGEKAVTASIGGKDKTILARLLRQLVETDKTGAPLLVTVPREELPQDEGSTRLIAALIDARLALSDATGVRIAHQRVLEDWARAEEAFDGNKKFYLQREGVEDARRRWNNAQQDKAFLIQKGTPLAQAEELVGDYGAELPKDTITFVKLSGQRARFWTRMTQAAVVVFASVALVAGGATYIAVQRTAEAEHQKAVAISKSEIARVSEEKAVFQQLSTLAALSRATVEKYPSDAVKLALAAWPRHKDDKRPQVLAALEALGPAVSALKERRVFRRGERAVRHATFSADGRSVLTSSADGTATEWDVSSGQEKISFRGHTEHLTSAAFSPDQRYILTASVDGTARLWDRSTGDQVTAYIGHSGAVYSAEPSKDGKYILTLGADRTVRVWDVASRLQTIVFNTAGKYVVFAKFSEDSSTVLTGDLDGTARLFRVTDGSTIEVVNSDGDSITDGSISPDGFSAAISFFSGKFIVFNLLDKKSEKFTVSAHGSLINSIRHSDDGTKLVTTSNDRLVRVWNLKTGAMISELRGHQDDVTFATFFDNDRRIISRSNDGTARIWDYARAVEISVLSGHTGFINSASISPDRKSIVTSGDSTARIWDIDERILGIIKRENDVHFLDGLYFSDGKAIITRSLFGNSQIYNLENFNKITDVAPGFGTIFDIYDTERLIYMIHSVGLEGNILYLTKIEEKSNIIREFKGHSGRIISSLFSPDKKRILTVSHDATARVWDVESGKELLLFKMHKSVVTSGHFLQDGKFIVTGSLDGTVRVWDSFTGTEINSRSGFNITLKTATNPQGIPYVAAINGEHVQIWNPITDLNVSTIRGHKNNVTSLSFSTDGRRLLTTSSDRTARIWDVISGVEIKTIGKYNEKPETGKFSPIDGQIVVVSKDEIHLHDVSHIPEGNIFDIACALLPDHDLSNITKVYGLSDLAQICLTRAKTHKRSVGIPFRLAA